MTDDPEDDPTASRQAWAHAIGLVTAVPMFDRAGFDLLAAEAIQAVGAVEMVRTQARLGDALLRGTERAVETVTADAFRLWPVYVRAHMGNPCSAVELNLGRDQVLRRLAQAIATEDS